jgi:hypothetical protein
MINWIRRIIYIAQRGYLDGRRAYPGEADFIEIPLYGVVGAAAAEAAVSAEAEPTVAAPTTPANDPHHTRQEIEA